MPDQVLDISPTTIEQLAGLRAQPKFFEAPKRCYQGAPNEEIRLEAEKAVNVMLDRLLAAVEKRPRKSYVLSEFSEMLKNFNNADSEEKEEACEYCEKVMKILSIERSDGLLNKWLYGFDPDREA